MELVALDFLCYQQTGVGLVEVFEGHRDELLDGSD